MPLSDADLWARVRDAKLPGRRLFDPASNPPDWTASFAGLLLRDGDWVENSARKIEQEYRKFLYLKALDGGELTPPACIDTAWHLHESFGPEYNTFCKDVLHRDIHHRAGLGMEESSDFYKKTLALYRAEFGACPEDIWPRYLDVGMVLSENAFLSYPWFVVVWLPIAIVFGLGWLAVTDALYWDTALPIGLACYFFVGIHLRHWLASPETIANCA